MSKKILITLLILILFALIGLFYFPKNPADAIEIPITHTLTIAEGQQPVFAHLYVAEKRGFFEEIGLKINYKKFTSGKDALNAVLKGEADIATVYETPIAIHALKGDQLSILTELHNSNKNTGLVARVDKGINTIEDLKGKKIGLTKNTSGEFFLRSFLKENNIDINQIEMVNTKPEDILYAISEGTVDAVATWNTHLFNVRRAFKEHEIQTYFSKNYTEVSVLATTPTFANQNKEAINLLLTGLINGNKYSDLHDREALQITINWLFDQQANTIRAVWDDAKRKIKLSNTLLNTLEKEAQWLIDEGVIEAELVNFKSYIMSDYLNEINADLVKF